MDWLRKMLAQIKSLWGKWTALQKIILVGIVAVVITGIVVMLGVSSAPAMVSVIDAPIRDENARDRIVTRINAEGVRVNVNAAGLIQVADEKTAQRMRALLIREDLIPQGIDPWAIFDVTRWTTTDFERNVSLRRAITQSVVNHIKALDEIDDANVIVEVPERTLFASEQNPVTASVIIFPKPGSDITENRYKIEGIQRLIKFAIQGLSDDNIVITDYTGRQLNDFAGMAEWDRLSRAERELKIRRQEEAKVRAKILATLQQTFTSDRVRDIDVNIDISMNPKSESKTEYIPFTISPRTPGLPYDDSRIEESVIRSETTSRTSWEGTGFNPEGPPGVEGQTPPVMNDMSNLYGRVSQETNMVNREIGSKVTEEEITYTINRITASVNIDGTWSLRRDERRNPVIAEDGSLERIYTPLSVEIVRATERLIQDAIGYRAAREDSVSVHNIQFDRSSQFQDEDSDYFRQKQMQTAFVIFLSGLTLLLIGFILYRTISREIERRKRLEAEERARREEALRQQAMMQAEDEGMNVSISVEERTRMELMENVTNMAKEHPEDVAQLIRTWLLEE